MTPGEETEKGAGSGTGLAMAYKPLDAAQVRWRSVTAPASEIIRAAIVAMARDLGRFSKRVATLRHCFSRCTHRSTTLRPL